VNSLTVGLEIEAAFGNEADYAPAPGLIKAEVEGALLAAWNDDSKTVNMRSPLQTDRSFTGRSTGR
jgi:hypothetical protein